MGKSETAPLPFHDSRGRARSNKKIITNHNWAAARSEITHGPGTPHISTASALYSVNAEESTETQMILIRPVGCKRAGARYTPARFLRTGKLNQPRPGAPSLA